MRYRLSNYHVATDVLPTKGESAAIRIVHATRTGRSLSLTNSLYEKLRIGEIDDLPNKTLLILFDAELLVPEGSCEFSEILQRNLSAIENSKVLTVVIQPTANCQLGCNYCGQRHRNTTTAGEVSNLIVARIIENLKRTGRKSLSVQWYGAEPLMGLSETLRISDRLIEYCREQGIAYTAHMITNGLSFKPQVFVQLLARNIDQFQITLDGTRETHDIMRPTKAGASTFDIILNNILNVSATQEYKERKCAIVIRINVNKKNSNKIPALLDLLAAHKLNERRVAIDFQPIVNWGDNEAARDSYSLAEFADLEIDWIMHCMRLGFAIHKLVPARVTQPCMAVDDKAEVYDADGNIYPCYEFPYTKEFEGAEFKVGNLRSIDEGLNEAAITRQWNIDIQGDIAGCRKCELLPVCGGGCPKRWYQGEAACPSFKENIKDRLILEFMSKKYQFRGEIAESDSCA